MDRSITAMCPKILQPGHKHQEQILGSKKRIGSEAGYNYFEVKSREKNIETTEQWDSSLWVKTKYDIKNLNSSRRDKYK